MEKNMMRLLVASFPQVAKIVSLLLLFLLAPLVPSSLRPPYLYLLFNALVVVLGVESGFLAAISSGPDRSTTRPAPPSTTTMVSKLPSEAAAAANKNARPAAVSSTSSSSGGAAAPNTAFLKARDAVVAMDAAIPAAKKIMKKIKRCPSRASIFFIGSGDVVEATVHKEEEEEKEAGWSTKQDARGIGEEQLSKQELFTKAEAFIGNFYKQLKMQREESWNKLQDLYHHHHYKTKAF